MDSPTGWPKPNPVSAKYNCNGAIKPSVFTNHNIPEGLAEKMAERTNMALAFNTKSNYQTVKNNIAKCAELMSYDLSFPWDTSKTLQFLAYLLFTRGVKANTANCQLSGVRMAHLELGLDSPSLRPPIVELLLRGSQHWESVTADLSLRVTRTPVVWETMLAIKRIVFHADWTLKKKDLFWAVCCLLYAGSLRVHEALSKSLCSFDPQTTLLGKDIQLTSCKVGGQERDMIKLKLKSPKEDRIGNGTTIEIFKNETFLCPVKAVKHYVKNCGGQAKIKENKPFFLLENKHCYTGAVFNENLKHITSDITDSSGKVIRSHSFRAGVPSQLARLGATSEQIQGVGRWSSDAYKSYCKLGMTRRMNLSDEISKGLPK